MKRRLMIMMAAAIFAFAANPVFAFPNNPPNGVQKRDGTGQQARKGKNQQGAPGMHGKQTGPRDGTGPIHTPPNGGGRRGGRR